jgi:hypothetical protein
MHKGVLGIIFRIKPTLLNLRVLPVLALRFGKFQKKEQTTERSAADDIAACRFWIQ